MSRWVVTVSSILRRGLYAVLSGRFLVQTSFTSPSKTDGDLNLRACAEERRFHLRECSRRRWFSAELLATETSRFLGPIADQPRYVLQRAGSHQSTGFGVWENYPDVVTVKIAAGRFFRRQSTAADRR